MGIVPSRVDGRFWFVINTLRLKLCTTLDPQHIPTEMESRVQTRARSQLGLHFVVIRARARARARFGVRDGCWATIGWPFRPRPQPEESLVGKPQVGAPNAQSASAAGPIVHPCFGGLSRAFWVVWLYGGHLTCPWECVN